MSDTKQPETRAAQDYSPFAPMLQGTGSNKLARITTRSVKPDVDAITGDATIADGDYYVFIEKYNSLAGGLRISTHKLLDACIIELTAVNHYRGKGELVTSVSIPLDEYVKLLGKPLTKDTIDDVRKRVKEDLNALYSVSIEWSERHGNKINDYAKMRILSSQGIRRGHIIVGFTLEFVSYLTGAYIMQYPKALLKIDERNASSYHIGRKLLLHYSIDNNRNKGTHNIISVRALLQSCPSIPAYEVVMNSDRALERRIKEPLINALSALDFISWEFLNANGEPLPDTQEDIEQGITHDITYYDLESFYIKFEVKDFPDQTARLTARADAVAAKAQKKTAKRKKAGGLDSKSG